MHNGHLQLQGCILATDYGGTKSQDSFWAKLRQNSTVRETRGYPFRYTCAGV